jgi:hypothetical protein
VYIQITKEQEIVFIYIFKFTFFGIQHLTFFVSVS